MEEKNLDIWADRLRNQDMPIFSRTVRKLTGLVGRDDSSFSELVWGILEDPSLTARVLRVSNSMHYNPSSAPISTISRAVMKLGFATIKNICLSIVLVETFLGASQKQKVITEIARALHAAIQAKRFAEKRKDGSPEEVFIAALLCRIGPIAFWCFAGEVGDQLESAMQKPGISPEQAEQEVLGFRLKRLTVRLTREWHLSSLLESALEGRSENDSRVQSIASGYRLAQFAERGWDSPEVAKLIKELGRFLKLSEEETAALVRSNAKEAAEMTESYGMKKSIRLIPLPSEPPKSMQETEVTEVAFPQPDQQLQLTILRDLSTLLVNKRVDFNMVLSIVLEGIHRGIGMDRVFFALLTPDRSNLKVKYGLGWPQDHPAQNFVIGATSQTPSVFSHALKSQRPLSVKIAPGSEFFHLLTKEVTDLTGGAPFLIMPILVKGQAIGVIYADRMPSGRELDEESFESFAFFGQQANLSLSSLAR